MKIALPVKQEEMIERKREGKPIADVEFSIEGSGAIEATQELIEIPGAQRFGIWMLNIHRVLQQLKT